MRTDVAEVLWTPDPVTARTSRIAAFTRFVRKQRLADVDELDYSSLHAWS